jgi:hypothetical protein
MDVNDIDSYCRRNYRTLMRNTPPEVWRIVGLAASLLFSLLVVRPGFIRLSEAIRATSADNYSFTYNYFGEGLFWLAWGAVALVFAALGFTRQQKKLALAALVLSLIGALAAPFAFSRQAPQQRSNISATAASIQSRIKSWKQARGHFPNTRAEMLAALGDLDLSSDIVRGGNHYQYRVIVAGVSDDYIKSPPIGAEFGDIYYTLSEAGNSYSLAIVCPQGNVSSTLVIDPQLSHSGLGK